MAYRDDFTQRTEILLGKEAMDQLKGAHVAVVGLGAVGSYAVEGVVRAGVGKMTLVDFDKVEPSNINRQLYATSETIGQEKAGLAEKRVLAINPDCCVRALSLFADVEHFDMIFDDRPDVIIDAIDSVDQKVALIMYALEKDIRVISSMGAALKTDLTTIQVAPLKKTDRCPLARQMRKRFRRAGVKANFPCVYSPQLPPDHARRHDDEGNTLPLGSMGTVTGIFGLTAAHTALQGLLADIS